MKRARKRIRIILQAMMYTGCRGMRTVNMILMNRKLAMTRIMSPVFKTFLQPIRDTLSDGSWFEG
jgi:hypothetical protein